MNAQVLEPVDEAGADAGGYGPAQEPALRVNACGVVKDEGVLEGDDVPFHALDLRDVGDPAGPVAEPGDLHDQVHRGGDLFTDGAQRKVHAGHQHQGFEAGNGVAGRVGVHGGQGAVVAGVHG